MRCPGNFLTRDGCGELGESSGPQPAGAILISVLAAAAPAGADDAASVYARYLVFESLWESL